MTSPMLPALQLFTTLVWLTIVIRNWRPGPTLRRTSLQNAWIWSRAAEFAWLLSSLLSIAISGKTSLLDQFWYWTSILTLCPLIAVLGSRRPTVRVWNGFIILPLIAVLGWPALTVISFSGDLSPIRLQAPVYLGFLLVMVMGAGNYVGTRFTVPIIMVPVGVWFVLRTFAASYTGSETAAAWSRLAASALVSAAVLLAKFQARRPTAETSAFDRLWFDFRDAFGIVWSLRIQERINQTARKEKWVCELGPNGFEWKPEVEETERQQTRERIDHALRWHLRRFADSEWIDEKLEGRDQDSGARIQE